ncbi:unnamed protein product [Acanthoscelides obtectus]|uniref:Uncharacterized protein n=1 Tax=Acanthoscelides obtectus TaxID=200917 RepID=A0A9P0L7B7_ACAOB|nr:unnamed protein product [Acanthoscelides obtectus]CAK1672434.1 hypothetical protein AOBTE_LOCUS28888 [Acanthoscelides obtectus]
MAHFSNISAHDIDEANNFAISLLRRTRPELTDDQRRIIAHDLVYKANKVVYQDRGHPLHFEARDSKPPPTKDVPTQFTRNKSIQQGESVFERLYERTTTSISLKYRVKSEATQTTPRRQLKPEGRKRTSLAPLTALGAPEVKKKRQTVVEPPNNVAAKRDVFERLYSSSKTHCSNLRQRNASTSSSTDSAESLKECIGSVQRALNQLNLKR